MKKPRKKFACEVPSSRVCHAEKHGWYCILRARHRGKHEAWATDPEKLCYTWSRTAKKAPRSTLL
jgi:hypothetical protein